MKATTALAFLSLTLVCITAAYADNFGSGTNAFEIEFVSIGNPSNTSDPGSDPSPPLRKGSVAKAYRIGMFEISEQMIDKANALGDLEITKNTRGPDKPATSVSWNEAARFVNWLNTSHGYPAAYKFITQPGDILYGANQDISLWTAADAGFDPANRYRNRLAKYFLPSVHEWYKAAYYDPVVGVYYDYATGSNLAPTPVASGNSTGTAVYNQPAGIYPADITLAGGLSPYGTMGQGGNVDEWDETDADLVNDSVSSFRGVSGGDWFSTSFSLLSSTRSGNPPVGEGSNWGFRVASVPEPSTLFLVAMAGLGFLLPGRTRNV